MRLLVAISLFLLTFLGLKYQPYIGFDGFSAEGGIGFKRLEINIGNLSIFVGDFRYRGGALSVGVVSVDIPPPPPRYAEVVEKPDYQSVGDILRETLGWLDRIPLPVRVGNIYVRAGELSVNLYRLRVSKGEISLRYGEVFLPNGKVFNLENLSLTGNRYYAILSGDYRFENLRGAVSLSADPSKGEVEVFSDGRFGKRAFSLEGELSLSETPRGELRLRFPPADFVGNFTLGGFGLKLNLSGRVGNIETPLKGEFRLYPTPTGRLEGEVKNLCNRTLRYTLVFGPRRLSFALTDAQDLTYISTDFPFGDRLVAVGSLGNGTLRAVASPPRLSLTLENAALENFCGLTAEGVKLTVQTLKGEVNGYLSFKRLAYPPLSLGREEIALLSRGGETTLSFGGSLRGLLALKEGDIWGYLAGEVGVNGKPLKVSLPLVELLSADGKRRANLWLERLSWDNLEAEDVKVSATAGEGFAEISLRGSAEGRISYRGGDYKADLSLWFFQSGDPRRLALKAEGNPREGRGEFRLEELSLSYSYKRKGDNLSISQNGRWKFVTFKGELDYGKRLRVRETLSLQPNPSGLTAVLTLIGEEDRRLNTFEGKVLPFCLLLTGEKVTCFQTGELKKEGKSLFLRLETYRGFPLYGMFKVQISEGKFADIESLVKVKSYLLNRYASAFGTYIAEPEEISIPFSYRGRLAELPEGLAWSYTLRLKLLSAYLYKPVSAYLTLAAFGGEFSGMVGLSDATSGTVYGTLSAVYSRGGLKFETDFSDLPLRVYLPETLRGYLNLGVRLKAERKGGETLLRGRVLSGGFLKVVSYKFPTSKGKEEGGGSPLRADVEFLSSEPLLVETPDGQFTLNYRGRFRNGTLEALVSVDYGELRLLGKTFYLHGGEVSVNGDRVSIDLPMVYYAPGRTVYLRIFGSLPWENLKFEIYSTPPAPEEELLASLLAGGGSNTATDMPLAKVLLQGATMGLTGVLNRLSSSLISGVTVKFEPSFDPVTGFAVGVDIEKRFDDIAKIGYHWFPSPNPKSTYLWGSMKFFYNTYLRGVRYSDGSNSLLIRFAKEFGLPF